MHKNNKFKIIISLTLIFVTIALTGCNSHKSKTFIWNEIQIEDDPTKMSYADGLKADFDLNSIITGEYGSFNTYVFSGIVLDRKEYSASWTDDNNQSWGPFRRSILEVKITKEYYGTSPVANDTIKVLYPFSLSTIYEDSISIDVNSEYVFVNCWIIDEKYLDYVAKYCPEAKNDESTKYADIIIGGTWSSLFTIEDGVVTLYKGYLEQCTGVVEEIDTIKSYVSDKITSYYSEEENGFISISKENLDKLISKLFVKIE